MHRITRFCLLVALPLIAAIAVTAAPPGVRRDTASPVEVRAFSRTALESYRGEPAFRYTEAPLPTHGLWSRIRYWVARALESLVNFATGTVTGKILVWLLLAALVIYIALRMAGFRAGSPVIRDRQASAAAFVTEDDIRTVDFGAAIAAAVREGNYRVAVRLWYLKTLQRLSDNALISWRPGGTNYEYLQELGASPHAAGFALLTRDFEYCWYGEEAVGRDGYRLLEERFSDFNRQIASA